jgi:hypothetical protein
VAENGLIEIQEMVSRATADFSFSRSSRERGYALFRQTSEGPVERMVEGRWVRVFQWLDWSGQKEDLDFDDLVLHVQRYLLPDLDEPSLGWQGNLGSRLRRTQLFRWLMPPLKGGAMSRLRSDVAKRSRSAYAAELADVDETTLSDLKEQAAVGYEHQRQRSAETEQRANFFLAAAGLTTSLVLANAGLLLGTSKLESPFRSLAAIALGIGSFCAIAAGFRAMQAMMIAFYRTPPNAVDRIVERRVHGGAVLDRVYVAALLVAQGRAGAIGDWKVNRLRGARRWFVGAIAGVVFLTGFVLAEAF